MKPFHLDDQIASQPQAVRTVLGREMPVTLDRDRPIVLAGEGTSLHACRVAAAWIERASGGAVRAQAIDSHSLALARPMRPEDQVVVVSHRGSKRYPGQVLARAGRVGATSICVTGEGQSEIEADHVIRTCADETSATHTVSCLTALTVLGRLALSVADGEGAARLGKALEAVPDVLDATLALPAPVAAAARLLERAPILVAGFDLDAITADEAALKIKEGVYLWAEGMSSEAAMHGPVAVYNDGGGAIVIAPAGDDGGRSEALARICAAVGMDVLHCGPGATDLPFVEGDAWVRPMTAVVPLQRLVAEAARLRGSNPDSIRNDEEPWTGAMKMVRL
jgi:glucosamine--fructose-6-phosphate aminotransferase (isomerizing)